MGRHLQRGTASDGRLHVDPGSNRRRRKIPSISRQFCFIKIKLQNMTKTLRIMLIIFVTAESFSLHAQDPSFSQFFSSPLNINPALTANINADWRLISNYRDQWLV